PVAPLTYLSDLVPASAVNGWGPYERDKSNGENAANDGRTLTLNGVTYAKGLGVNANSTLIYNLNGQFAQFLSDIGVDDEVGANGNVDFQVFADNVLMYDSGAMTGNSATKSIAINVMGKNVLKLVVSGVNNNASYAHGDWANARLTAGQSP